MQIYELTDKRVKITLIKMLKEINERQVNKMRKSIAWTEWIYQKENETIF